MFDLGIARRPGLLSDRKGQILSRSDLMGFVSGSASADLQACHTPFFSTLLPERAHGVLVKRSPVMEAVPVKTV